MDMDLLKKLQSAEEDADSEEGEKKPAMRATTFTGKDDAPPPPHGSSSESMRGEDPVEIAKRNKLMGSTKEGSHKAAYLETISEVTEKSSSEDVSIAEVSVSERSNSESQPVAEEPWGLIDIDSLLNNDTDYSRDVVRMDDYINRVNAKASEIDVKKKNEVTNKTDGGAAA